MILSRSHAILAGEVSETNLFKSPPLFTFPRLPNDNLMRKKWKSVRYSDDDAESEVDIEERMNIEKGLIRKARKWWVGGCYLG